MSKVNCSYELELKVMPSMCDQDSLMSMPAMLDMFQDVAGIHAESIGIGALDLEEKGLFWIVSKIRLKVYDRPVVQENIDACTWIQISDRVRCERDWAISQNGKQLAYIKSIWAALRRDNGKPALMEDFYPDSDFSIAPPDDEPFMRIKKNFDNAEPIGEYKIRSVDIDRGGHMNNVNYVRAMLGFFTCAEIREMNIHEMEIQYLQQCYEGDIIRFVKRPSDDAIMEIGAINEDGKVCFLAAVK